MTRLGRLLRFIARGSFGDSRSADVQPEGITRSRVGPSFPSRIFRSPINRIGMRPGSSYQWTSCRQRQYKQEVLLKSGVATMAGALGGGILTPRPYLAVADDRTASRGLRLAFPSRMSLTDVRFRGTKRSSAASIPHVNTVSIDSNTKRQQSDVLGRSFARDKQRAA